MATEERLIAHRTSMMLGVGRRAAGALLRRARCLSTSPPKKDTVRELAKRVDLKGQVVLVRADLNLPLSKGADPPTITDATRLTEALPTLRLLPISGGIFAGAFRERVPRLTREALDAGFAQLPEATQQRLLSRERTLELCIFAEAEFEDFVRVGFHPDAGYAEANS